MKRSPRCPRCFRRLPKGEVHLCPVEREDKPPKERKPRRPVISFPLD